MASSGDELASYQESPRVNTSGGSKPASGPSRPSRRKKGAVPVDAIAISSDEDGRWTNGKGGKAVAGATLPASNSRAKGKGKATATLKRTKVAETNEVDAVEETTAAAEENTVLSRHEMTVRSDSLKGKNRDRQRQQIERLQKQLEDVTKQRDAVSGQFEGLFQLRHTEAEQQLAEQKAQYEARLKAQEDTIQELQDSLSRVDTLSRSGGNTSLHFLTRETADEEKLDVQREVSRLTQSIKERDGVIQGKDVTIQQLDEMVKVLRADLQTEIENTKALTSRNTPSGSQFPAKSGDPKNALAIRLYEELTNLLVTNVKHEPGQYKDDEAIYTCVQTSNNGNSLNFTLRFFKEAEDGETPASATQSGRTVDKVIYSPLLLERESEAFVKQLDFMGAPFVFGKDQMCVFTSSLLKFLDGEGEDNESSSDQMEAEEEYV